MGNKFEITDPNEIHLMLVEKFQNSNVNIVIRAVLDKRSLNDEIEKAARQIAILHPYCNARYFLKNNAGHHQYYYEELDSVSVNVEFNEVSDSDINIIMNSLSRMRTYRFDHESGKLWKLIVYTSENRTLLELCCSHIVGEIPSILILMGDLLKNIDNNISGDNVKIKRNEKYLFDENDFGWKACQHDAFKIENTLGVERLNPWDMPKLILARHKLPVSIFDDVKKWLCRNNIKAKVSDVFYYVAKQVLADKLGKPPDFWLILSYRNKAKSNAVAASIYNFAFFSPVSSASFDSTTEKNWLEDFYNFRDNIISNQGVCQARNFFYSLNKAMEGQELQVGRDLMNSVIKFPDFAFNNFGKIDAYIGSFENINVVDFDVQDGTPIQEIRYFSLHNQIYINPAFFEKNEFGVHEFWDSFSRLLGEVIKK